MEGVPRIPMLSFPMKRSADTPNFKPRLKAYISDYYNENPDSYTGEINELDSLRAGATHISKDFTGCATLKKYFCQLNFLKSRFPMHEGSPLAVTFSWYDVYSDQVHGWSDIDFEMSCILFNIGALHTELGALEKRQSSDGIKSACTHFQCAAWAFQHLRHNYQKFFTPDISPDILSIIINVCLGQAQECILEKSLIDNRKSTIQAKVALYIVEYYQLSLKTTDQMLKDSSQYSEKTVKAVKKWRKLIELKVSYYSSLAHLFRGIQAEDQQKWGERITFYKSAAEKLEGAFKLSKNMDKTDLVHETLIFTNDVILGKLKVSEKENEFIYHDKVPELNSIIGDLKGVSLVKGVPLNLDDPDVSGPDIFSRLVPMEAHEASSLYSEEKAKLLRTYSSKIEEKNHALENFILAIQLNQLDLHTQEMKIPQALVDCVAALSVDKDALKKLSDLMSTLSGLYHDVDGNLNEIHDTLLEQEAKEKEYQLIMGKRPPNNLLTELSREEHKHQSNHKSASDTNQQLREILARHMASIKILMNPLKDVMKHIPSASDIGIKDENAIIEMQRLAEKVEEMQKQREMLETQLRDSIQSDDITKQLVVKKDEDQDELFREELKKHEKITKIIDQNLMAQENIIRALTEANANYAETRKATADILQNRSSVIQGLLASYQAYDELLGKCNTGIAFYKNFDESVSKLLQRVRSVSKVQDEERENVMKSVMKTLPTQPPTMRNAQPKLKDFYQTPAFRNTNAQPKLNDFNQTPASSNTINTQPKLKDFYQTPAFRNTNTATTRNETGHGLNYDHYAKQLSTPSHQYIETKNSAPPQSSAFPQANYAPQHTLPTQPPNIGHTPPKLKDFYQTPAFSNTNTQPKLKDSYETPAFSNTNTSTSGYETGQGFNYNYNHYAKQSPTPSQQYIETTNSAPPQSSTFPQANYTPHPQMTLATQPPNIGNTQPRTEDFYQTPSFNNTNTSSTRNETGQGLIYNHYAKSLSTPSQQYIGSTNYAPPQPSTFPQANYAPQQTFPTIPPNIGNTQPNLQDFYQTNQTPSFSNTNTQPRSEDFYQTPAFNNTNTSSTRNDTGQGLIYNHYAKSLSTPTQQYIETTNSAPPQSSAFPHNYAPQHTNPAQPPNIGNMQPNLGEFYQTPAFSSTNTNNMSSTRNETGQQGFIYNHYAKSLSIPSQQYIETTNSAPPQSPMFSQANYAPHQNLIPTQPPNIGNT